MYANCDYASLVLTLWEAAILKKLLWKAVTPKAQFLKELN